jgi:hypothetical protein
MAATKQKQDKRHTGASTARASAGQPVPSVVPAKQAVPAKPGGCEEALERVLQRAGALAEDSHDTRQHLPSGRARPDGAGDVEAAPGSSAGEQLTTLLRELDPETALTIRTLMIAGRDGQSIPAVNVNLTLSDSDAGFAVMAADSRENGPLLLEYLRRGHAIACAAGIDLERPLEDWQARSPNDVDERAWLSFGKQLATSAPGEWQCLCVFDPSTRELSKLYLRLNDRAWWSFQALLDRPTRAGVEKERRALARRRLKGVPASTLDGLAGRLGSARGRALRRAARAICARLGQPSSSAAG